MDFTKLNTKESAERGAWLHLHHPSGDYPLYTGEGADDFGRLVDASKDHKPVRVRIRGHESQTFRSAMHRINADKIADMSPAEAEKITKEVACALVIEFDGIEKDGSPMEATHENLMAFFSQSDALVMQVIDFAKEARNFFSAASMK